MGIGSRLTEAGYAGRFADGSEVATKLRHPLSLVEA